MKSLVTGSRGCIGRTLVEELERRGHDVWGCDLFHTGRARYTRCDVRAYRQFECLFDAEILDLANRVKTVVWSRQRIPALPGSAGSVPGVSDYV